MKKTAFINSMMGCRMHERIHDKATCPGAETGCRFFYDRHEKGTKSSFEKENDKRGYIYGFDSSDFR